MKRGLQPAVASALTAAVVAAGCGLGAGASVGSVTLTVSRDYGAELMLERTVIEVSESDTVMRVLDRSAEIETRYGGGFVEAIDGVAGGRNEGRLHDWFFYVNGVESPVGAADLPLRGGERIWWDYRDWTEAMRVPAVVGSFPEPFAHGYGGERRSTVLVCRAAAAVCGRALAVLRQAGAMLRQSSEGAIRVLVGTWGRLRSDPAAAQIEKGPQVSGVFADFLPTAAGLRLAGLTTEGVAARRFGPATGLIAATRRFEGPPVWVLTGVTEDGVRAAVAAFGGAELRDRYALASASGATIPLPLR